MLSGRGGWRGPSPPVQWFGVNWDSPQAKGLIGWWPTTVGKTNVLRDYVGGNHLDSPGALTWVRSGELGTVADFSDTEYAYSSKSLSLSAITLSIWLRFATRSNFDVICAVGTTRIRFNSVATEPHDMRFDYTGTAATTSAMFYTNTWYHLALTWNGDAYNGWANGVSVVNGNKVASPSGAVYFGGDAGGTYLLLNGQLADFRLYNRALSAAEVRALYDPATRWDLYAVPHRQIAKSTVSLVTGVAALSGAGALSGILTAYISGPVVWGHDTSVIETAVRDFTGNWTGTGSVENSGDSERIALDSGEIMTGEITYFGSNDVYFLPNHYQSGDNIIVRYRTAATVAATEAAGWNLYTYGNIITSLGFVQLRVESTL